MKAKVYFTNSQKEIKTDKELRDVIRAAVDGTLERCAALAPKRCEVSVSLVDGQSIAELNAEHRGKDAETDVLSFPMFSPEELPPPDTGIYEPLGDIVLNLSRTQAQALELGHSFLREAAFLTVHSMLHLLGYDHENGPEDEEKMCALQREIIQELMNKGIQIG